MRRKECVREGDRGMDRLAEVQKALCQFIINTSKKEAPEYAVQALPETVKALVELSQYLEIQRYSEKNANVISDGYGGCTVDR